MLLLCDHIRSAFASMCASFSLDIRVCAALKDFLPRSLIRSSVALGGAPTPRYTDTRLWTYSRQNARYSDLCSALDVMAGWFACIVEQGYNLKVRGKSNESPWLEPFMSSDAHLYDYTLYA